MMDNTTESLKIIQLNTNSIISHQRRHNLQCFLQQHKPDIMLLCETRLSDMHNIHLKNYNTVRVNKQTNSAMTGTAILLKHTIKTTTIDTISWNLQALEITAVLVHTTQRPICVISSYRSATNNTVISHDLEIISEQCKNSRWDMIIGGDFNAKHPTWNNISTCTQGRALANWLAANSIQHQLKLECPAEYTYRNNTSSSVIDFFIISDSFNITRRAYNNCLNVLDFDSDHRAVIININLSHHLQTKTLQRINNYHGVNWSHFKNQLDSRIRSLHIPADRNMCPDEIDSKVAEVCAAITDTMSDVIPTSTVNRDNIIVLPPDILDLLRQKKSMRRRWERLRLRPIAAQLKTEIKLLTQIINQRITITRNAQWSNKLSSIQPGPSMFRKIKSFSQPITSYAPKSMLHPDTGANITQTADIANILAAGFEKVHTQNDSLGNAVFTTEVNNLIANRFQQCAPRFNFSRLSSADSTTFDTERHLISVSNLKSIIKSRANKKSCGHDKIPNIVLRKLSHNCTVKIAILFNQMYNICHFPAAWKLAIVTPLLKPSKAANMTASYRPISLLPCLSKIYEKAIKETLERHCEDQHVLPDDQFGFTTNRSTTQALVILKTDISKNFNNKTPTIACATDIEKAFDTVWREGLIFKMLNVFHFDEHSCRCIYEYLLGRKFRVKVNDSLSDTYNITAGVPQGGVLSALLYIIYIADMPTPPAHSNPIRRLQYADDMIVYVSVKNLLDGQDRINAYLQEIVTYMRKWKIRMNPAKSEVIVFKGPNKHFGKNVNKLHNDITVKINSIPITPQRTLKYLGVTFSKNLQSVQHVNNLMKKVNATIACLRPLLRKHDGLSKRVKMLCYKQLIRSQICYGFPAWSDVSSAQMERIRQVERACIRTCTSTWRDENRLYIDNSRLLRNAEIDRIDRVLVEQALKFLNKQHDNCQNMQRCLHVYPDDIDTTTLPYKPPWHLKHLDNGRMNVCIEYGV